MVWEGKHAWNARREFWDAYNEAGAIDYIVPAFGTDAYRRLLQEDEFREALDEEGGKGRVFLRLRGCAADQSVLLFRMSSGRSGAVYVLEWSHKGAMRMWLARYRVYRPPHVFARLELVWAGKRAPLHVVSAQELRVDAKVRVVHHWRAGDNPAGWRVHVAKALHAHGGIEHPWGCHRCSGMVLCSKCPKDGRPPGATGAGETWWD